MPVAARFHELRDKVLATVDAKFSEPVRISFMVDGRPDANREQVTIEAVLRVGEGKETNAGGGRSSTWRSRITAGKGELHIDRTTYPDLLVKQYDRVRALSRPGQPLFEVLTIDDRGHTRLVLQLGEK